ncbi:MAG: hypothetical protein M1825_005072 [Sarcosagium campestre]|nr:MAG: hypothetical protein M1825_005072 [Sarcosagium campestre]
MAPMKRLHSRLNDKGDSDVQSASAAVGSVRGKRVRVSDSRSYLESRSTRRQDDDDDDDGDDGENDGVDQGNSDGNDNDEDDRSETFGGDQALPVEDYAVRRDNGFVDLQDEDMDTQRATQIIRKRNEQLAGNIPAEQGIIESVTCINFMCHNKLHVAFGPLINFIIGHNGSGKSAVLTAITLCLGGKASATNRGQNLKSFIKEGQETAVLIVKLKNQGSNGFQQDIYGDSIVIERQFSRTGTSGFKLKSESGRIISTKKAELEEIIDFFTLQIDNPMNVLTQDMARQFLNNSTATEKYRFFLKGVQLEQLDQDYRLLEESIDTIEQRLYTRDDDIRALKQTADDAAHKLRMSEQHDALRGKINNLGKQMAWAQVEEQEELLRNLDDELESATREIGDAEALEETTGQAYTEAHRLSEEAKEVAASLRQSQEPLREERRVVKEDFDKNKGELLELQTQQRTIRDHLRATEATIVRTEQDILKEQKRLEDANGGEHARRQADIDVAKDDAISAKVRLDDHRSAKPGLEKELLAAKAKAREAGVPIGLKRTEIRQNEDNLQSLMRDQGNQQGGFPESMPILLRAIRNESGFREMPVGPVGNHVRLLKPIWSSILEKSFGGALSSFIVTSKADQDLLSSIMRRVKCSCPIMIGNNRPIDISNNEPDASLDTTLRVLEIDNDLVRRQLIINQAIEQTVLIESRQEARSFMFDGAKPRNVKQCYCLHNERRGWGVRLAFSRGVEPSSSPMPPMIGKPRMKTDSDYQIRRQREDLQHLKRELVDLEQEARAVGQVLLRSEQALFRHDRESKSLQVQVQKAEEHAEMLEDELEKDSAEAGRLDALKAGLAEAEEEKRLNEGSYEDAINSKDKLNETARALKDRLKVFDSEIAEIDVKVKKAAETASRLADARHVALQKKNVAYAGVATAKAQKGAIEGRRAAQENKVTEFASQARQVCSRVPVDRGETADSLDRKLDKLSQDLQRFEREIGASHAELAEEAAEASHAYRVAQKQVEDLKKGARILKLALVDRQDRWRKFRRFISSRARANFTHLLSERGFRGSLRTDHVRRLLDLQVEPDETKSGKGRQTKTLSGGEKSFSTICLLLALWDAMGSPIRCLDEFDVFMDSVNRTVSMNMMIEAARRSIGRQFVLITPQSMNNIAPGPDVKIIKLNDPERGQTSLAFDN